MKLELIGHDDRYAVEQLQMSLFSTAEAGEAVSQLFRGKVWLTAVTVICRNGKTTRGIRRMKASEENVRQRRQILQQSYYAAALEHLPQRPEWGAISGVRPTKITTKLLQQGETRSSAKKLLRDVYYVSDSRADLAVDCSAATVRAAEKLNNGDVSLYVGIPFCPTRCSYCSFVSQSVEKSGRTSSSCCSSMVSA